MSTPRVIMLIPSYFPTTGGAEYQLRVLSKNLIGHLDNLLIITRRIPNTSPFEEIEGVPVYRLLTSRKNLLFLLSTMIFLLKRVHRFDILHVHTLTSPLLVALFFKICFGKKLIVKVTRSGPGSALARFQKTLAWRLFFPVVKRFVDAFVAINEEAESVLVSYSVPRQKIVSLRNGVDCSALHPISSEQKENMRAEKGMSCETVYTYVGRLIERKNVMSLIKAVSALSDRQDFRVLIAGDGPERCALEIAAKECRHSEKIIFLGNLARDKVCEILALSDVFVLPSESEGISNALLEAMAFGNAAVVSNVYGNREVITHGQDGFLFNFGSVSELSDVLQKLSTDAGLRRRCGRLARDKVERNFSIETITREYLSLYSRL